MMQLAKILQVLASVNQPCDGRASFIDRLRSQRGKGQEMPCVYARIGLTRDTIE